MVYFPIKTELLFPSPTNLCKRGGGEEIVSKSVIQNEIDFFQSYDVNV